MIKLKKFFLLTAFLAAFTASGANAASTPVKISLLPALSYPEAKTVHGLDLGLISTSINDLQGVQFAFIYAETENKSLGAQFSLVGLGKDFEGAQFCIAGLADNFSGVQLSFYNGAKSVKGIQLGFINVAEQIKGIQIGLVNVIKKGRLPVMVIVNGNF